MEKRSCQEGKRDLGGASPRMTRSRGIEAVSAKVIIDQRHAETRKWGGGSYGEDSSVANQGVSCIQILNFFICQMQLIVPIPKYPKWNVCRMAALDLTQNDSSFYIMLQLLIFFCSCERSTQVTSPEKYKSAYLSDP